MKVKVPDGMLKAVMQKGFYPGRFSSPADERVVEMLLEKALEWLSKNPIVPTEEQINSILRGYLSLQRTTLDEIRYAMTHWPGRMFLEPEEELPEEIGALVNCCHRGSSIAAEDVIGFIRKSYQKGLRDGRKG